MPASRLNLRSMRYFMNIRMFLVAESGQVAQSTESKLSCVAGLISFLIGEYGAHAIYY